MSRAMPSSIIPNMLLPPRACLSRMRSRGDVNPIELQFTMSRLGNRVRAKERIRLVQSAWESLQSRTKQDLILAVTSSSVSIVSISLLRVTTDVLFAESNLPRLHIEMQEDKSKSRMCLNHISKRIQFWNSAIVLFATGRFQSMSLIITALRAMEEESIVANVSKDGKKRMNDLTMLALDASGDLRMIKLKEIIFVKEQDHKIQTLFAFF